jgi:hypothetical protein
MFCAAIQEFAYSLPADAGLLRASLIAGEPVDQAEVLSLASQAQSLFISTTLASRQLGVIDRCRDLWGETAQLFDNLCQILADVETDDPQVQWLTKRLTHFASLARDRTSLYNVSESARREFAERKAFDSDSEYSFGTRGEIEPVREFSKLETASIERAYRRHPSNYST